MTSCEKLTQIADEARARLLAQNSYKENTNDRYSASHPNATVEGNDEKGKGTGIILDTTNGGSIIDREGIPSLINSGRRGFYSNLYTNTNEYKCIL